MPKTSKPKFKLSKVPFAEAIEYFQNKVDLPTSKWTDIMNGMHSRAFVVAGAMKNELLEDIHSEIGKALADGTTITEFRKAFADTVKKHGWKHKGGFGWRSNVIFNTNLRTAYNTGRYKQQTDPDVLKERPYFEYIHGNSMEPRPEHLAWNGTVLPADDPWWKSHYPPNGWGCTCRVESVSNSEMKRRGLKADKASLKDGSYEWTHPDTGEVIKIPNGIDPGWNHNVGETAWGKPLAEKAMARAKAQYERLTPGNYATSGLAETLPVDKVAARPDRTITQDNATSKLEKIIGGKEKTFSLTDPSSGFRYDFMVNAETLASHLQPSQLPFFPMLPEIMESPTEVWLSFEMNKKLGNTVLRTRFVKAIDYGKEKGMLAVFQASGGFLESWTLVPTDKLNYLNKQRIGKLIWKR